MVPDPGWIRCGRRRSCREMRRGGPQPRENPHRRSPLTGSRRYQSRPRENHRRPCQHCHRGNPAADRRWPKAAATNRGRAKTTAAHANAATAETAAAEAAAAMEAATTAVKTAAAKAATGLTPRRRREG